MIRTTFMVMILAAMAVGDFAEAAIQYDEARNGGGITLLRGSPLLDRLDTVSFDNLLDFPPGTFLHADNVTEARTIDGVVQTGSASIHAEANEFGFTAMHAGEVTQTLPPKFLPSVEHEVISTSDAMFRFTTPEPLTLVLDYERMDFSDAGPVSLDIFTYDDSTFRDRANTTRFLGRRSIGGCSVSLDPGSYQVGVWGQSRLTTLRGDGTGTSTHSFIMVGGVAGPSFGDVNGDDDVTSHDIDSLYAKLGLPPETQADRNCDGNIDTQDVEILVHNVFGTEFGDINIDGRVDNTDFGLLLGNFGAVDVGWGGGDLDGDGVVGNSDFGLVLGNFGFAAATANLNASTIPEPSTLLMAITAFLALATFRRRT